MASLRRSIAIAIVLVLVAGCGPSERPKFNIKRASDYEPLRTTEPRTDTTATTAPPEPAGTEMTVVEIGAFKGECDRTFSGINGEDLVSLANAGGMRSYRLAGIAIPAGIRGETHERLRGWLEGEALGIEVESGSGGGQPAVYIVRCSTKTWINEELVREGLAMVADTSSAHRDALNQASMEALTARRGVWGRSSK